MELTEAAHFQSKLVEIEELALIKGLGKSKPKPKPKPKQAGVEVRARAPEGPVQGLRHGLLRSHAPEGPL